MPLWKLGTVAICLLAGLLFSVSGLKVASAQAASNALFQGVVGEAPRGWFVPTPNYSARLVEEGSKPGQHSVLLQKDDNAAGGGAFGNMMRSFSAAPHLGKKLRYKAMVRFEGAANKGRAQMWMRVDRANGVTGFFDNMGNRPIQSSTWGSYEIGGPIADDAQAINIGLMLIGQGKVWIDSVVLEVQNGDTWVPISEKEISNPPSPAVKPLDPKREQQIVSQLKQAAVPFTTVEAGHGFDDLSALDKIVGDARIVSLGEASHGTREFFQMKHRILEYLVNKKGFTVFAIEANWPEADVADRYIKTGAGDPVSALDALYFWTWHTREVADMIQWMRDYNKRPGSHPTLTFTSFDMQTPQVAAQKVQDYIRKASKTDLGTTVNAYARFLDADTSKDTPAELAADRTRAESIGKLMDSKSAAMIKATSEADYQHARQCARIVQQAATMKAEGQKGFGVRDQSMAENVKWLVEKAYPNQKIVLWAHNGHVADTNAYGVSSMGHHLRQMFGSKMVVLGFGFDKGQIRALKMTGGKFNGGPVPLEVPAALEGSVESVLRQAGPRFILDFRSIAPTSPLGVWLDEPNALRQPGAAWDPDQPGMFFQPAALSKMFDGIIFIAESHASDLLPYGLGRK